MADNHDKTRANGAVGLLLGSVLAAAALMFILSGGQLGGVKDVTGDADMPPIATGKP